MSGRVTRQTDDELERYPRAYREAEFNRSTRSPPYGPAWPGGFTVGAGALMLFFGVFFVILVMASLAGPLGWPIAAALAAFVVVAMSMLMWWGLGRYIGSYSGLEDDLHAR